MSHAKGSRVRYFSFGPLSRESSQLTLSDPVGTRTPLRGAESGSDTHPNTVVPTRA